MERHIFSHNGELLGYALVDIKDKLKSAGYNVAAESAALNFLCVTNPENSMPYFDYGSPQCYRQCAALVEYIVHDSNLAKLFLSKEQLKTYKKSQRIAAEDYILSILDDDLRWEYLDCRLRMYEYIFENEESNTPLSAFREAYTHLYKIYAKS